MKDETETRRAARPCLLLVDDTPANIDILVELLQGDYELRIANSGAKALRICEGPQPVDLILLDVMMPEMDGFQVCRTLRERPATREIPVIFLTAKAEVDDVVQGLSLGANDYVTKPFRPAELRARVMTHLLLRTQARELESRNRELRELLHIVCHDVANQFSVISMSLDLQGKITGAQQVENLARIGVASRNGIALTCMVRDLRLSEDKRLELSPVAIRPALEEALLLLSDRLSQKQIGISVELPDVELRAERCSLVNSVLGNILSNAAKFSPRGSHIEVKGELRPRELLLRIRDHGIGMPAKILDSLFDVARSRSRRGTEGERGTGFGMPLMRRFVAQYGGEVEVESREQQPGSTDHGTEFRLRLPLCSGDPASG